jgi:DME family drug/metabolite transporter
MARCCAGQTGDICTAAPVAVVALVTVADGGGGVNGRGYIIAAALLWGSTGTAQAFAPAAASPLSIGTLRLIVGGAALLLLACRNGHARPVGRCPWLTAVAAGLCTATYQVTFFTGVKHTGVAVGTLVAIGSAPIFAGLLEALFEQAKLQRQWVLATGLAIAGSSLLVGSGSGSISVHKTGIVLALGAGLSYALFTLLNKRLMRTQSADFAMASSFCLGAVMLTPFFLQSETGWVVTPVGTGVVLYLGLIATGLSYALFGRGLRLVGIAETATLSLAEPLTAAMLGIFLLAERLSVLASAGALLLFVALVVLAFAPRYAAS